MTKFVRVSPIPTPTCSFAPRVYAILLLVRSSVLGCAPLCVLVHCERTDDRRERPAYDGPAPEALHEYNAQHAARLGLH